MGLSAWPAGSQADAMPAGGLSYRAAPATYAATM